MRKADHKSESGQGEKDANREPVTDPVDMVDGLADHSGHPAKWKYIVLAAIFLAWVAFMIVMGMCGAR